MQKNHLFLGLILILLGSIAAAATLTGVTREWLFPLKQTTLHSTLDYRGPPSIFGSEFDYQYGAQLIQTKLEFQVAHPEAVAADKSFVVSAKLKVIDAKCYIQHVRLSGVSKEPSKKTKEEQLKEAIDLFRKNGLSKPLAGVELAISGADFAPNQIQAVNPEESVSWSVRPRSAGIHKGFVFGKWMSDPDNKVGWRSHFDDDVFFTVEVEDKVFTLKNCILWFVNFMGPLLTLSGILALWKSYRKAKQKREESKPKIIIP